MANASPREEKSEKKWCPICNKSNVGQRSLVLRQINMEEAVYVCENPDCCYPVGFQVDCIKRSVPTLIEKQRKIDSIDLKENSARRLGIEYNEVLAYHLIWFCFWPHQFLVVVLQSPSSTCFCVSLPVM